MPSLPSNKYWAERAEERMLFYERDSERAVSAIRAAYQKALRDIEADAMAIYRNFAKGFDLTEEEARFMLAQSVSRGAYDTLLQRIADIKDPALRLPLEAQAASGAYGYRLSRLESLRLNLDAQITRLAEVERGAATAFYQELIPEAYNHSIFDIQHGTGLGFSFDQISTQKVQEILRNPWSGKHFSEQIWGNTRDLVEKLNETITSGFLTGRSVPRMARDIAERMKVGYHAAERLVRTETNYMANAAEMQSYRECGIEKYVFLATLDVKTSQICQEHDLQEYSVDEAVPGVNQPPLHPRCRSTTIVLIDGDTLADMERRARDPVTGELVTVSGNIAYGDWQKSFQIGEEPFDFDTKDKYNNSEEFISELLHSVDDLTYDQKRAIVAYTGSDYTEMNRFLRTGSPDTVDIRRLTENMQSAFGSFELPRSMHVYRGIGQDALTAYMTGNAEKGYIKDDGFMSTSISKTFANSWRDATCLLEISLPKGYSGGLYVEAVSDFSEEREFILRQGEKFKLVSFEESDGKTTVRLEVIADERKRTR